MQYPIQMFIIMVSHILYTIVYVLGCIEPYEYELNVVNVLAALLIQHMREKSCAFVPLKAKAFNVFYSRVPTCSTHCSLLSGHTAKAEGKTDRVSCYSACYTALAY